MRILFILFVLITFSSAPCDSLPSAMGQQSPVRVTTEKLTDDLAVSGTNNLCTLLHIDGAQIDLVMAGVLLLAILLVIHSFWSNRRFRRELELRANTEQQLKQIAARFPGALFQLKVRPDKSYSFPYLSDGVMELLGVSAQSIMQDSSIWKNAVLDEDLPNVRATMLAAIDKALEFVVEYRVRAKSGEIRWVKSTCSAPTVLSDGTRVWNGLVIDITGQRKTEAALLESEHRYRTIADNLPGVLFQFTRTMEGKRGFTFMSDGVYSLAGIRPQEVLDDFSVLTACMDQDSLSDFQQVLLNSMETSRSIDASYPITSRDGTSRWVRILASTPVDQEGRLFIWNGLALDITEMKDAQNALATSEERHRTIVENVSEGLAVVQDGVYRYVNKRYCDFSGYSESELVGNNMLIPLHPDCHEYVSRAHAQRMNGKMDESCYEVEIIRKDGSIHRIQFTAVFIEWEGRPAAQIFAQDITERKAAEVALRESEQFTRTILEQSPMLIAILVNGNIAYINPAGEGLLGSSSHDLLGKPLANHILPEYQEHIQEQLDDLEPRPMYLGMKLPDGSVCFVQSVTSRFTYKGEESTLLMAVDTTELKQAEEALDRSRQELAVIFQNTADGVLFYDSPDMVVKSCNRVAAMHARCSVDDMVGSKCHEIYYSQDTPCTGCPIQRAFVTGLQEQAEVTVPDGRVFFIVANPVIIDGSIIGVVETAHDMTSTRLMEDDLRKAKETAEEAVKAKSLFLAHMSHELRTPMTGILGLTDHLSSQPLPEEIREDMEVIRDSSRSLMNTLNDILDYIKYGIERTDLEHSPLSLFQLLQSVGSLFKEHAQRKGIVFKVDIADYMPNIVLGDEARIKQILNNLLSNAIKFTETGCVTLSANMDMEGAVIMKVSDTGIGMTQDQLERVFNMFEQAESSTTRRFGGSGLGLSICNKLVSLMGGTLEVESAVHKGSTFTLTLYLPVVPESFEERQIPPQIAEDPVPDASLDKLRLLMADDVEANRWVFARYFRLCGCQVDLASDGKQAVQMALANAYDILFMDCHMPIQDGVSAALALHGRWKQEGRQAIPIIALSADVTPQMRKSCHQAGMVGFAEKPFNFEIIKELMRKHTAEQQPPEPTMAATDSPALSMSFSTETDRPSAPARSAPSWQRHQPEPPAPPRNRASYAPTMDETIFDEKQLMSISFNEMELARQLAEITSNELPLRAREIRLAMEQDNPAAIRAALQKLRETASNIGSSRLQNLCSEISLHLKNGDNEQARSRSETLLSACRQCLAAIDTFLHREGN